MNNGAKPKRILFVENGIGYGGAIICLRHLARNLDREFFLPMVITGRTGPQYEEIAQDALWKHIPDRHFDAVAWRNKLKTATSLNKIPAFNFIANQIIARADDIFNFLPFFISLLWTAWRFKADLVHANNDPVCNRAALLVAKTLGIPSICHIRSNPVPFKAAKIFYQLPDFFIPVSNWVAERMRELLGIPDAKMQVVYDGINLDQLDLNADGRLFRQKYHIPEDAYVVGLVGLLIPWKGQDLFIDAAKILKEQIPNLKMPIIGGTPDDCIEYENRLRERVTTEDLENIIVFTGHTDKMEAVYNGLDIVVSASTDPEPLGTVVIESMAMGRPVVGPNHGGAAEMLEERTTGLLFKAKDHRDFCDAVLRVFNDNSLADQLGKNAKQKAFEMFAIKSHTKKVQMIYREILS
ncbi:MULTISPECIES: glycosyltransferase family 4 protein [Methylomonas]|uniref:Uncharacterized protein n=1 Tax=Methylomonas koyamae TaxID=702114 RepID=A0A291IJV7_9GAMM|nr:MULTISPECIES: glycosyltransferase family 4 protein [Methylomonas]ANE55601.1 hypothetical protein AYM39_10710 [Methylomonas sp. DH-1]ATG90450.1 hypothetical protein MKLM6_2224 [Methylomonas koyamae]OAI21493.1 hypothetical protein A1356_20760 [Methylomonas koyamae]